MIRYKQEQSQHGGNGICNNRPFSSASEYQTAAVPTATATSVINNLTPKP